MRRAPSRGRFRRFDGHRDRLGYRDGFNRRRRCLLLQIREHRIDRVIERAADIRIIGDRPDHGQSTGLPGW